MIVRDLLNAVRHGRTPIVLTERTVHLEHLQSQLTKLVKHVVVFRGGMGTKQRKSLSNQLSDIPGDEGRVLVATERYLGEGFDYAPLDTAFWRCRYLGEVPCISMLADCIVYMIRKRRSWSTTM